MKKRKDTEPEEEMTPEERAVSDDYLSKLANSVLRKESFPYKDRVQGPDRTPVPVNTPPGQPPKTPSPRDSRHTPRPAGQDVGKSPTPRPPSARTTPRDESSTPVTGVSSPPSSPRTPRPTPRPARTPVPNGQDGGTFPVGTILLFEDGNIGVYKDPRTEKDYEVVSMLHGDGTVNASGLALENYDIRVLGVLPPEFMFRLNRRETWERDEIIYHLNVFDHCALIPHPEPSEEKRRREAEPLGRTPLPVREKKEAGLVHGRRFTIVFGDKDWSGIYWGEDDLGTVVAHQTHDAWALMHLDLDRFKDSLKLGDLASKDELVAITNELQRS